MERKEELILEVMTMVGDQVDGHTYTSIEIKLREMYDIGYEEGEEAGVEKVRSNPGDYIEPPERNEDG